MSAKLDSERAFPRGARCPADYVTGTVENFIRLLTDRWLGSQPASKRLMTDNRSNVLIYMTGHGGNEFFEISRRGGNLVFGPGGRI
jgi:hypothetical protein